MMYKQAIMSTTRRKTIRKAASLTKLPTSRETHGKYLRAKEASGVPIKRLTDLAIDALSRADARFAPA
jgi:hypothetical protein